MFQCGRCDKIFDQESKLKKHLTQRKTPCDFFCLTCKTKFNNRFAYKRHEHECTPTKINIDMGTNNDHPTVIMGDNHNHINIVINITFENPNMEQLQQGIMPHETEGKDLLRYHANDMYKMFQIFITRHPDGKYKDSDLRGIVVNLVQLFYSNEKTPQHMNIFIDNPESDHHKVFSGTEFIDDLLPRKIRTQRLMQILLFQLKQYMTTFPEPHVVTSFIHKTLIPFIVKSYFGELCARSITEAISKNADHLAKLNIKKIPEFPFKDLHLTPASFKAQFSDFRKGEDVFRQELQSITEKDLNNIEIDIIRKQNMFLK